MKSVAVWPAAADGLRKAPARKLPATWPTPIAAAPEPGLSISVEIFIALSSGLISALGVWFKLKSTVQIQKLMIDNIETNLKNAHERITNLKTTVEANKEKNETAVADLKAEISAMEMRIIKAIHEIGK